MMMEKKPTRIFFFEKTLLYLLSIRKVEKDSPKNNPRYAALLWTIMIKKTESTATNTEKYFQNPLFIEYPVKTSGSEMIKKPAYKLLLADTEIIL